MIQFRLFVDQNMNLDLFNLETTEPCQLTLKVGSFSVKPTKLQESVTIQDGGHRSRVVQAANH